MRLRHRRRTHRTVAALACALACCVWSIASVAATTVLPADFAGMVAQSQIVVHGRVIDVRAQFSGTRRSIESVVTLAVVTRLKGVEGGTVVFRVPGGRIGPYRRVTVGAPVLAEGDEVVLFLRGRPPIVPMPYGLNQGVYRVTGTADGRVVTPLVDSGPGRIVRGDPARRPLSLEAFAQHVRALVARP
jgi:hypothetical protein